MIPLKCDSVPVRLPAVTVLCIALCCAAYVLREQVVQYTDGFVPVDFMHALLHPGAGTGAAFLSLALSFFMHAGIVHLLTNMWYLWIFGSALESTAGAGWFAPIYAVSGALSMVIQAASSPYSGIPVVGASGAIAGVMGAFLLMLPLAKLVLWFPPFFMFRVPAFLFLLLWFVLQYVNMRYGASASPVAWWAHIGGFCVGFLCAAEIRRRELFGGGRRGARRARHGRAG